MSRPHVRSFALRALGSLLLFAALTAAGIALAAWKRDALAASEALAASQPEPVEAIASAEARPGRHVASTTAVGTVRALRWVTLQNELAGTVESVAFESGEVVEPGQVLVALDVSVEQAELDAAEANARLADAMLGRMARASESRGASEADVDRAQAEADVARAEVERLRALIERKRVRAPFRARAGLADVHPGQYLEAGTVLTTLQGVDEAVHVDFRVAQDVARGLGLGERVEVHATGVVGVQAEIVAHEARVDALTRTATLRARVENGMALPAPGGSVRVRVPVGQPVDAVVVPVSALRKGPSGEHVFVLVVDEVGALRVRQRRVTSGPLLGDEVMLLEGLSAGEQVAASGSFKLFDGMRVQVVESATVAAAAGAH